MKTLRFDSVGGASGDMILASLLGLGADLRVLLRPLRSLKMGRFSVRKTFVSDHGLIGARVTVSIPKTHHHPERCLADIKRLIKGSRLAPSAKAMSIRVFERLARAEAKVHGTTRDRIHFHEVGAVDSMVDIVGSCVALDLLGVRKVTVGPLPCGYGTNRTDHGVLPNPAPATVELLKGHPVVRTDEPFELVTPTGAALLMEWKNIGKGVKGGKKILNISGQSNAFGHATLDARPNLLRAMILEEEADETAVPGKRQSLTDNCLVLESNIDDTSPELIGALAQKLMDTGALDVFTIPAQMKKQRPGTLLTVLCRPEDRDRFIDTIFRESSTFGIREHMTQRTILPRRHIVARTPYGRIRVKVGTWKGKDITHSPEFEDCLRCSRIHKVPLRTVYGKALRFARR